ncbi:MAG: DUF2303 family protein [Pseudomonadota bacterium]
MSEQSEAATIADLAVAAHGPRAMIVTNRNGREFLILPDRAPQDISEPHAVPRPLPETIEQQVALQTAPSLANYVNRFKDPRSLLFADIAHNKVVAHLDYHAPDAGEDLPARPAGLHHAATLILPYSEEWATWTKFAAGGLVDQLAFARFIEENAVDVAAPSGADLLEVCRDIQAVRKVNFKKAVRTATDHENFEYSDETEARTSGGLEIPTRFLLRIPVYFGDPETELYAFLRWKLDDGALKLGVVLHRAEHVRQAVFQRIVHEIAEATGLQALFGRTS